MGFTDMLKDVGFGNSGNSLANSLNMLVAKKRQQDFQNDLIGAEGYLDFNQIQKIAKDNQIPLSQVFTMAEQRNNAKLSSRLKELMPQIMRMRNEEEYQGPGGTEKLMKDLGVDSYEIGPIMEHLERTKEKWTTFQRDPTKDIVQASESGDLRIPKRGAPGESADNRTSLQKEYDRYKKNNPEFTGTIVDFKKMLSSDKNFRLTTGPDGETIIEYGDIDNNLTTATKSSVQKDIVGLESQLTDLKTIRSSFEKDFLTYGGKLKGVTLRTLSKAGADIGPEGKQFVGRMRVFQEKVEQFFNAYRKEITGAQAAIKELQMLRKSVLNKDLAPDEFAFSLDNAISLIERQMSLKKTIMDQGITGKSLDQEFNRAVENPDIAMQYRGDAIAVELEKQGLSGDELTKAVTQRLIDEGY